MSWSIIFQVAVLLASLGAASGIGSAVFQRSKVHAESTAILTGISTRQIEKLQADLEKLQSQQHKLQRALLAHQRWDTMVLRKLESVGVMDITDPPDIFLGAE
jgi:NADP-dependent 3-hydroxy acid dehydrogenase YdfG